MTWRLKRTFSWIPLLAVMERFFFHNHIGFLLDRFGPQMTWPLQIINEGSYTMEQMIQMRNALKEAEIRQPVTFPIRAGLSTSPESQKTSCWLLDQVCIFKFFDLNPHFRFDSNVVNYSFPIEWRGMKLAWQLTRRILDRRQFTTLTIWSSQYDMVDVPRLMELVNRIGKENIFIDVPSGLNCEIHHFVESIIVNFWISKKMYTSDYISRRD